MVPLMFMAAALQVDAPMIPAFFTAGSLYRMCTASDDAQCLTYVAGALDGIFYARFSDGERRLCPTHMTNREAAGLFVDYMKTNEGATARAAAAVLRKAVAPRIECEEAPLPRS